MLRNSELARSGGSHLLGGPPPKAGSQSDKKLRLERSQSLVLCDVHDTASCRCATQPLGLGHPRQVMLCIAATMLLTCVQTWCEEGKSTACEHCNKPLAVTVRATDSESIKNFTYLTDPLTVSVGDTVTWTNNDTAPHTATSDAPLFDTGTLNPGQSKSFTFTTAGTFPYHCTIHPFMHGTVIVQGASGPVAPVLTNLTATAKVNAPFTYTITATGTTPITFGATLPAGLTLNVATITGTFTQVGTVNIPLTATNAAGTDSKNLVVTVTAVSGGSSDLSGTWTGTLKANDFNQTTPSVKGEKDTVTLTIVQSAAELTATVAISGKTTEVIQTLGQVGNTNLWLSGSGADASIGISGHVDKKGATIKGLMILYGDDGDAEITFSVKR